MKYKIEPMMVPTFEPITITITLENMAELKSMWARYIDGRVWLCR